MSQLNLPIARKPRAAPTEVQCVADNAMQTDTSHSSGSSAREGHHKGQCSNSQHERLLVDAAA
jgi:hypothetical protein